MKSEPEPNPTSRTRFPAASPNRAKPGIKGAYSYLGAVYFLKEPAPISSTLAEPRLAGLALPMPPYGVLERGICFVQRSIDFCTHELSRNLGAPVPAVIDGNPGLSAALGAQGAMA